jgi:hypothetical protein
MQCYLPFFLKIPVNKLIKKANCPIRKQIPRGENNFMSRVLLCKTDLRKNAFNPSASKNFGYHACVIMKKKIISRLRLISVHKNRSIKF